MTKSLKAKVKILNDFALFKKNVCTLDNTASFYYHGTNLNFFYNFTSIFIS